MVDHFGCLNILLNSAGAAVPDSTISKTSVVDFDLFRKHFDINVFGTVYNATFAAEAMSKNEPDENGQRGVIVNISSVAGEEADRMMIAYGSSKGAVNGITVPMARDLGRFGIRVLTIAPGIIETPMGLSIPDRARDFFIK